MPHTDVVELKVVALPGDEIEATVSAPISVVSSAADDAAPTANVDVPHSRRHTASSINPAIVLEPDEDPPETPLPLRQMTALLFVLVNESLCANMLFPIVGLLVASLETESPNDAGYQTGMLVGVYQLGQVVSSKIWGRFSDQYGRRPALFMGAVGSGVCMFLFGLSTSFWGCVLMRFFHGAVNGNVLVAKATIADITDKTNESKGFTLISFAWGFGSMIGPAIGGFLYQPGDTAVLRSLGFSPGGPFDQRPALLPSLVITCYSAIAAAVAILAVTESNINAKPIRLLYEHFQRVAHRMQRKAFHMYTLLRQRISSSSQERVVLATDEEEPSACSTAGRSAAASSTNKQELEQADDAGASPLISIPPFGYYEAFTSPRTRNPLILYALLSAFDIIFCEVFPLWAIATRNVGGVGLEHSQIGTVIVCGSIPTLAANLGFSFVRKYVHHDVKFWRYAATISATTTLCLGLLMPSGPDAHVMLPLIFWFVLRIPFNSWCFSLSFVMISRSAPREHVGAMNGIGQSAGCFTRALIPPIIAPLFAWSIDPSRFIHIAPFNHTMTFWIAAAFLASTIPMITKIEPDTLIGPRHYHFLPVGTGANSTRSINEHGASGGDDDDRGGEDVTIYPSTPTTLMSRDHHHREMLKPCTESTETLSL
jgi:MFS family permease